MKKPPVLDSPRAIWNHLEALIDRTERRHRTLWIFVCDDQNRPLVVSPISDVPADASLAECRRVVSLFAEVLADAGGGGALLVVITRPSPSAVAETDRSWYYAVHGICREHGVRVLGVHLMTPDTHRAIAADDLI
jgi:hypothetical protein